MKYRVRTRPKDYGDKDPIIGDGYYVEILDGPISGWAKIMKNGWVVETRPTIEEAKQFAEKFIKGFDGGIVYESED